MMTGNEATTNIIENGDVANDVVLDLLVEDKQNDQIHFIDDRNRKSLCEIDSIDIIGDAPSKDNAVSDNKENALSIRTKPIIHSPTDKRLCDQDKHTNQEYEFIGLDCVDCLNLISDPQTTIPQIFAAMREWLPPNQKKMDFLIEEMLKRGAHVDDVDGLEGNTMLHYACKSASEGVGNRDMALPLVKRLLDNGCNPKLRSRWTDMLPLHYAAYFDCPEIMELLLNASSTADIDARCKEYDQGTSLHIAASGLCYRAASYLVERGADPTLVNQKYKIPYDCITEGTKYKIQQSQSTVNELKTLLKDPKSPLSTAVLEEIGLSLGDEVIVGGDKIGKLLFCGKTEFASGVWCGVELLEKQGKNDGSVAGVTYFKCSRPGYGTFAPPSKLAPLKASQYKRASLENIADKRKPTFCIGDRVSVIGYKLGYIRFIGKVKFSGGLWVGVELDKPYGKCDGSIDSVRYFLCKPQHGIVVTPDKVKRSEKPDNKTPSPKSPLMMSPLAPASPSIIAFDSNRAAVCSSPMRGTPIKGAMSSPTINKMRSTIQSPLRSPGVARSNSGQRVSPARPNLPNSGSVDDIYKKQIKLQPGMNAFINGEIGTVKYVGRVDFSDGIWVGVVLKTPTGKNDGTVQGKKYFICKPGYGLMVKPAKVSVHGINASKMIVESDYPV